jgi:Domain of unknown function (DUF6438)
MSVVQHESDQAVQPSSLSGIVWTALAIALVLGVILAVAYLSVPPVTETEVLWRRSQEKDLEGWAVPPTRRSYVRLERTGCFGDCPSYSVSVTDDGTVTFKGRAFTCINSPKPEKIDPRLARRLIDGLLAIQFWSLPFKEGAGFATDNPTVEITLRSGAATYMMSHYHGDMGAPRLLYEIEDHIDQVANANRWIGLDKHGRATCDYIEPSPPPPLPDYPLATPKKPEVRPSARP